jgi:hypothetical protein
VIREKYFFLLKNTLKREKYTFCRQILELDVHLFEDEGSTRLGHERVPEKRSMAHLMGPMRGHAMGPTDASLILSPRFDAHIFVLT